MKTTLNEVTSLYTTETTAGKLTYGLDGLSAEIVARLALHGLKQKVGDAAAIPRCTVTGKSATEGEKLEAMRRVWEALQEGDWSIRGEGTGASSEGLLFRAICLLKPGSDPAEVKAKLAGMSKADQAKMRAGKSVAEAIARIKLEDAEKRGKSGNTSSGDDLLDEF